jgi:MFS transporter, ACS family, glucarate transporter
VVTTPPASRVRMRVLGFAFALTAITYLDRICISAAAPFIMRDLSLTALEMSFVFSAFTLAYSLFEVPSGWLGDVRGPHRVLTRIVVWWSLFTMATAFAQGFRSLLVIRSLFGAGEAGAFPNMARSLSRWFPRRERGRANGVMLLGSRVGGMISVPLALLVISWWGWRMSFVVFGLTGVAWAIAWQAWYRDRPEEHPAISLAEIAWIQQDDPTSRAPVATPWRALFRSRNLYAICAMYFAFGYGLYFYFTWLPTYLIQELGFSPLAGGAFAALPFFLAGLADVIGGWLTDRLSHRFGLKAGRCYLGFTAFFTCGVLLFVSTLVGSAVAKALLLALALASADFGLSAAWAVSLDIAPDHGGVMTGWMNTFGNLGGLFGPIVVGYAIDRWQSWTIPFYIAAVIYVAGAAAWLFIDPSRTLAHGAFRDPVSS